MSKRRKPIQVAELPPIHRGSHDEIEMLETTVAGVMVARAKLENRDALHYLWKHGHLSDDKNEAEELWQAGMAFRLAFHVSGREPGVTGMLGEHIPGGGDDSWSQMRIDANGRYERAASRLAAHGLLDLLLSVAVMGNPICGHWRKSGRHMVRLREGLDILRKGVDRR